MLTPRQRQLRAQFVMASEMPAICGVDPYRSVADVWARKRGLIAEQPANDAMRRGSYLERGLLDWARDELGRDFRRDTMVIHGDGVCGANFDGLGDEFIVEAKTSRVSNEWGEPGTDEIPDRVKVQVAAQMHVAGPAVVVAYIPALIDMDLRLYRMERDEALVEAVAGRAAWFKREVWPSETPPEGVAMSLDTLRAIKRVPGASCAIDPVLIEAFERAREAKLQAEMDEDAAKAALMLAMGDAEIGEAGDWRAVMSRVTRHSIDVKGLQ